MTNETRNKLFLRTLAGETVERPPIWLMRQAGRYLPEYREERARAGSFLDLCYKPRHAIEVTLQPIRRFGFDASILFADILLVPQALGQKLWFAEGEGPRLEPVTTQEALAALSFAAFDQTLAPVFETVAGLKAALPRHVALIGFAGAPWTVASYMIAGRGTPDQAPARRWSYRDPLAVDRLIALLVEATIRYLSDQVRAGAEVVQLFDTWAGNLPEPEFTKRVIEPTRAIVAALKSSFPGLPVIGFPKGAGALAARYAAETGVDALGCDPAQPLAAMQALQRQTVVQGNLDPLLLVEGGPALEAETKRLLSSLGPSRYIFNLGHGIVPETPPDHVARLVEWVQGR